MSSADDSKYKSSNFLKREVDYPRVSSASEHSETKCSHNWTSNDTEHTVKSLNNKTNKCKLLDTIWATFVYTLRVTMGSLLLHPWGTMGSLWDHHGAIRVTMASLGLPWGYWGHCGITEFIGSWSCSDPNDPRVTPVILWWPQWPHGDPSDPAVTPIIPW